MSAQSRVGVTIEERYRLQEEIGRGRLSTVYHALDAADGDASVAVKLLDTQHPDGLKQELFKRETAALKRLRHPNIICLQQSGWSYTEKCFYLVLDYVPYSLERYMEDEPGPQLDNFNPYRAIRELAGAVAHSHARGVVHRDIKPSNVLIGENGQPRLADFGISKLLDQLTTGETLAKYWSGGYASPEQRMSVLAGPESDIYSLGAVFYRLLSNRTPPPEGPTPDLMDEMNEPIQLRNVLKRMLEADPKRRGYSGSSLVESLETITRQVESLPRHYLVLTNTAVNSLEKEGYITDRDSASRTVQENLGATTQNEVHIRQDPYKPGNIQILGDSLRLICAPHNGSALKVITIHAPHVSSLAKDRDNAMPYRAIWELTQEPPPDGDGSLNNLLAALDAHQKENTDTQKRRRSRLEFIQQWLDALNDRERHLRGQRLEYESVDETRNGMRFTLAKPPPDDLEWPDDSPLVVETSNGRSTDVVVGDLIDIRGTLVSVAKPDRRVAKDDIPRKGKLALDRIQARTSIRRQISASYDFLSGQTVNPKMADAVVDPAKATRMPEPVLDFYQDWLSVDKKAAVSRAVASNELFLIRGPPGTGKTAVIAEIALQILKRDPGARILLSSQSNVAVDHAMAKIGKAASMDMQMIRLGRDEKIGSRGGSWTIARRAEACNKSVRDGCNAVIGELKRLERSYKASMDNLPGQAATPAPHDGDGRSDIGARLFQSQRTREILSAWVRVAGLAPDFSRLIVEQSNVVGATCLFSGGRGMPEADFDWVIIDEAGRATLPETLVPMVKAERAILVGDERQLPPMIDDFKDAQRIPAANNDRLDKSLFQSLVEEADSDHTASLSTQYRMHPAIGRLVSEVFYEGKIKQGTEDSCRVDGWMRKPVTWLSTSGMRSHTEVRSGQSFANPAEARLILQNLEDLERRGKSLTVGVISGYSAQVRQLLNTIRPNGTRWRRLKIEIATVDSFQGRECDVVVYSTVRSNPKRQIGFQKDYRRINVALSRARDVLVIVGDAAMMRNAMSNQGNPFAAVLRYLESHREDCDITNVPQVRK